MTAPDLIQALKRRLGAGAVLCAPNDIEAYQSDLLQNFSAPALCVARPRNTQEVQTIVALAGEASVAITAAGGRTGFCGGAVPGKNQPHLILSLERLRRIRAADPVNDAIICEAGVTLAEIHQAADAVDRCFPVSHGGEGTSQIGGMVATNAGGNNVLRYGMARAHILGLEVVLANGDVWDGLRILRKDNAGYDLKQMFIGSEGTLGIVTAAALGLQPKAASHATALLAVKDPQAALEAYTMIRARTGEFLSAFELVPRSGLELHLARAERKTDPFSGAHDWMILVEAETRIPGLDLGSILEESLAESFSNGLVADAIIARSQAQRRSLWSLREGMAEAQASNPLILKSDTSVPIGAIADFVADATRAMHAISRDLIPIPFGHIGDGNIHFNVAAAPGTSVDTFAALKPELSDAIMRCAFSFGGSISAEHGLGQAKLEAARCFKSPIELDLMRRIKRSMDADNLFNPGKVIGFP